MASGSDFLIKKYSTGELKDPKTFLSEKKIKLDLKAVVLKPTDFLVYFPNRKISTVENSRSSLKIIVFALHLLKFAWLFCLDLSFFERSWILKN